MISGNQGGSGRSTAMPPTAGAAELPPPPSPMAPHPQGRRLAPQFGVAVAGVATSACWLCADGARGDPGEVHAETHKTKKTL